MSHACDGFRGSIQEAKPDGDDPVGWGYAYDPSSDEPVDVYGPPSDFGLEDEDPTYDFNPPVYGPPAEDGPAVVGNAG